MQGCHTLDLDWVPARDGSALLNSFFDLPNSIILPFFYSVYSVYFQGSYLVAASLFEGIVKYGMGHST